MKSAITLRKIIDAAIPGLFVAIICGSVVFLISVFPDAANPIFWISVISGLAMLFGREWRKIQEKERQRLIPDTVNEVVQSKSIQELVEDWMLLHNLSVNDVGKGTKFPPSVIAKDIGASPGSVRQALFRIRKGERS